MCDPNTCFTERGARTCLPPLTFNHENDISSVLQSYFLKAHFSRWIGKTQGQCHQVRKLKLHPFFQIQWLRSSNKGEISAAQGTCGSETSILHPLAPHPHRAWYREGRPAGNTVLVRGSGLGVRLGTESWSLTLSCYQPII